MKYKLITILTLIILGSCTPKRRLERMQKMHPYLFTKIYDTINHKEIIKVDIPEVSINDKFKLPKTDTTIAFEKENMKAIFSFKNDSLQFDVIAPQKAINVPIDVDVPVPRYSVEAPQLSFFDNIKNFATTLFILILLVAVYKTAKSFTKKSDN